MKNVVLCCDGTANEFAQDRTNVVKLFYALDHDPARQIAFYHPGLGTMEPPGALTGFAKRITRLLGKAIGYGLEADVRDAYVFLMNHFEVAQRRHAARTPVHDVGAAVDQPLFPEAHKCLAHRARQMLVHGEELALPVHRVAQPLHLLQNVAAVLHPPLPDALQKRLASHLLARESFCFSGLSGFTGLRDLPLAQQSYFGYRVDEKKTVCIR